MPMTKAQFLALDSDEQARFAGESLGLPYRSIWGASQDGGRSFYFSDARKHEVESFLAEQKRTNPNWWTAKGTVHEVRIYPNCTTTWEGFGYVVEAMKCRNYDLAIHTYHTRRDVAPVVVDWFVNLQVEPTSADGDSIPRVGTISALIAVGAIVE